MTIILPAGQESDVRLQDDGFIHKLTKRSFPTSEQAERYAADVMDYHAALLRQGYTLPAIHDVKVEQLSDGKYGVVQITDFIDGPNLASYLRTYQDGSASQGLVDIISQSGLQNDGFLATPIDSKPDNFIVNGEEEAVLVDILPPLVQQASTRFPYHYISHADNLLKRAWIDRYVRTREGVITRFVTRAIHEVHGIKFLANKKACLEVLNHITGSSAESFAIQRRMIPFLGMTAAQKMLLLNR